MTAGDITDIAAARAQSSPRRTRVVVAVVAAALILAAAVAVPRVRSFYRTVPLTVANVAYDDAAVVAPDSPSDDPPTLETTFRYGQDYSYRFDLVNTTRHALRVLNLPIDRGDVLLESYAELVDGRPLRPFTLHPHEHREITVRARFTGCANYGYHSSTTMVATTVDYRLLGATRQASLDLPSRLKITAPRDCPELGVVSQDSASGTRGTIDANVRFTLPDYRFWVTNWDKWALLDCRVDVNGGAKGAGVSTHIPRIDGRHPVLVSPDRFTDRTGAPWQAQSNPPTLLDMTCNGTGLMTATLSPHPRD